jgi:hypothetical protein
MEAALFHTVRHPSGNIQFGAATVRERSRYGRITDSVPNSAQFGGLTGIAAVLYNLVEVIGKARHMAFSDSLALDRRKERNARVLYNRWAVAGFSARFLTTKFRPYLCPDSPGPDSP